jgi:hypothetical protein
MRRGCERGLDGGGMVAYGWCIMTFSAGWFSRMITVD